MAPALLTIVVGGGGLAFAWSESEALGEWAMQPNVAWGAVSVLAALAAAAIVVRSYAQLRQPSLFALVLLLLPWIALQPLHYANAGGERALTPPQPVVGRIEVKGAAPEPEQSKPPVLRRFIGLPDNVSKRYPELVDQLRWGVGQLHALGFLFLPGLVLLATLLRGVTVRRRLRVAVLLLLALQVVLALAFLLQGGLRPDLFPRSVAPALYGAAVVVALLAWRSPGGIGGGIAVLLLLLFPAALAELGQPPSRLGLPLKPLPFGVERALLSALPWLLLALVGREWIVGMSHSTQHDALTQIFNKAYAEAIVNETNETSLGRRYCIAILDIDHFKKVNDSHGHSAGDDVLAVVAKTISDTVHNRGLVCRTGGEEITVFFPGVDEERAKQVCEEVRVAVEALQVPTRDNEGKRVTLNVTLSVGVASNASGEGRIQDVVAAADRAVYSAKDSGRNQVVVD